MTLIGCALERSRVKARFRGALSPVLSFTGHSDPIIESLKPWEYLEACVVKLGSGSFFVSLNLLRNFSIMCAIKRQKRNWADSSHSTLIVDYEKIWSKKERITLHLGIDDDSIVSTFLVRKCRKSRV